ncbi:acyl-CoA N-acyltransferase [Aspergillus ellipticus CBS 707.79]|uniref:Acyl-CoA N-acyltransferase n=1 Tax=Aspergillus ellipticus CBS 707.79 TaxID=1448320 RepID=A0A319DLL8_9EURO|nr:acyl-CoA N-acyltransferase [Aspergillus ellipticus CBS 707.79]
MTTIQTPEYRFRSQRLVYRSPEDSDSDKAFYQHQILNDPTIQSMSSLRLKGPVAKKSAEEMINIMQEKTLLGVVICLPHPEQSPGQDSKPKPIPIGQLALFNMGMGPSHHHRHATLGISLVDGYRGKGYGGEAINWILDWAFMHAGLHRVGLDAFSFNENGLKLYRKLGFVEEGRQREVIRHLRGWHDVIKFSMLEDEWEKLRGFGQEQKE